MIERLTLLKASNYAQVAQYVANLIQAEFETRPDEAMQGRSGAYFCVSYQGVPIIGGLVGVVASREKWRKYDRLSREKCERVFSNRVRGHRLSRESVDQTLERYTGGVAGNQYEYGLSGYPSDVDELGAGMVASLCEDLYTRDVEHLFGPNPYFPRFREYLLADSSRSFGIGL